jgi:hypothetical protein
MLRTWRSYIAVEFGCTDDGGSDLFDAITRRFHAAAGRDVQADDVLAAASAPSANETADPGCAHVLASHPARVLLDAFIAQCRAHVLPPNSEVARERADEAPPAPLASLVDEAVPNLTSALGVALRDVEAFLPASRPPRAERMAQQRLLKAALSELHTARAEVEGALNDVVEWAQAQREAAEAVEPAARASDLAALSDADAEAMYAACDELYHGLLCPRIAAAEYVIAVRAALLLRVEVALAYAADFFEAPRDAEASGAVPREAVMRVLDELLGAKDDGSRERVQALLGAPAAMLTVIQRSRAATGIRDTDGGDEDAFLDAAAAQVAALLPDGGAWADQVRDAASLAASPSARSSGGASSSSPSPLARRRSFGSSARLHSARDSFSLGDSRSSLAASHVAPRVESGTGARGDDGGGDDDDDSAARRADAVPEHVALGREIVAAARRLSELDGDRSLNRAADLIGRVRTFLRRHGLLRDVAPAHAGDNAKVVPVLIADAADEFPATPAGASAVGGVATSRDGAGGAFEHATDARIFPADVSASFESLCLKFEQASAARALRGRIRELLALADDEFVDAARQDLLAALLVRCDDSCVAGRERAALEERVRRTFGVRIKLHHWTGEVRALHVPQTQRLADTLAALASSSPAFADVERASLSYLDDGDRVVVRTDREWADALKTLRSAAALTGGALGASASLSRSLSGSASSLARSLMGGSSVSCDVKLELFVDPPAPSRPAAARPPGDVTPPRARPESRVEGPAPSSHRSPRSSRFAPDRPPAALATAALPAFSAAASLPVELNVDDILRQYGVDLEELRRASGGASNAAARPAPSATSTSRVAPRAAEPRAASASSAAALSHTARPSSSSGATVAAPQPPSQRAAQAVVASPTTARPSAPAPGGGDSKWRIPAPPTRRASEPGSFVAVAPASAAAWSVPRSGDMVLAQHTIVGDELDELRIAERASRDARRGQPRQRN